MEKRTQVTVKVKTGRWALSARSIRDGNTRRITRQQSNPPQVVAVGSPTGVSEAVGVSVGVLVGPGVGVRVTVGV